MLYIHDVWVNFTHGFGKGYTVPAFHEWRKTDNVELLDQTPLLFLTDELYASIEDDCEVLPTELLEAIENKSYVRKNAERLQVQYMVVVTDGKRHMAIKADDAGVPVNKSRLIPRQEQLVIEMITTTSAHGYGFVPTEESNEEPTLDEMIVNLDPVHMYGLTRREREMKTILMDCVYRLSCSTNLNEVRYWYTELFPGMMIDITTENWSIEDMVADIFDHLSEGWDEQHEDFGVKITKRYELFTDLWNPLHKITKDEVIKER